MPTLVAVRGGAGHDTFGAFQAEEMADEVPSGKGQHDAGNGHRGRRCAGPQQLDQVGFQPDLEQENHHADFLQEMKDGVLRGVVIAQIDQAQDGSPQEDARQQLAQHRRLADPAGERPQKPRGGQHDCQGAEQCGDLMRFHGRFRRGLQLCRQF